MIEKCSSYSPYLPLNFQFVNDGFDLLELRSLVWVSIPADVNDPLEMVIDGARDHRSR